MNRHLGATYSLSVLIVVACAVAFRGAEGRAGPKPGDAAVASRVDGPKPTPGAPAARAKPATVTVADRPAVALAAESRRAAARIEAVRPPVATAPPAPLIAAAPVAPPVRPSPPARPLAQATPRHRGAFARAEPGETLADAARRLYGSEAMAEALWRANRDQLPSPSAPIEAGMVLRTP